MFLRVDSGSVLHSRAEIRAWYLSAAPSAVAPLMRAWATTWAQGFRGTFRSGPFRVSDAPELEGFEQEAAAYLGVPHAIGVANGTMGGWSQASLWYTTSPSRASRLLSMTAIGAASA